MRFLLLTWLLFCLYIGYIANKQNITDPVPTSPSVTKLKPALTMNYHYGDEVSFNSPFYGECQAIVVSPPILENCGPYNSTNYAYYLNDSRCGRVGHLAFKFCQTAIRLIRKGNN